MDRPIHLDVRGASVSPSRMMFAVSFAVLLEAGAIYLVGSGLAMRVIRALPQPLDISVIAPPTKTVQLPPPSQTQLAKPSLPAVTQPVIVIQPQQPQIDVVPWQHPVATPPTVVATAQPLVTKLPGPVPPRGIAATHTQPPYPMLARRMGKEGIVVLDITVGMDGGVQNVSISKSSGDNALDEEALDWVKAHWRYRPATRDGQPVVAQSQAQVVFNLKQSGR